MQLIIDDSSMAVYFFYSIVDFLYYGSGLKTSLKNANIQEVFTL